MESLLLVGLIPLSLLIISSISVYKMFSKESDILHLVIIHIDKNNNYIEVERYFYEYSSDIVELDVGYRLNHYHFDYNRNVLVLFVKSVDYDLCLSERIRELILPKVNKHILIKEKYK